MNDKANSIPFSLAGIDHIVFLVDDLEKAMRFYLDVLGCQPGYSYPELGMEQVWAGISLIVLWDYTHEGGSEARPPVLGGQNVDHVCLAAGPFDHNELRSHLKQHGVEIEREAFHGGARGVGNSFYFCDPFGNKIELKGPPPHPDEN
ncbi:VOC family protein [Maritalea sp.]|uniref:VOC family protein n=1 Tax=Maritalea sp. TaxID=2003361 RepID=UPI003EF292AD